MLIQRYPCKEFTQVHNHDLSSFKRFLTIHLVVGYVVFSYFVKVVFSTFRLSIFPCAISPSLIFAIFLASLSLSEPARFTVILSTSIILNPIHVTSFVNSCHVYFLLSCFDMCWVSQISSGSWFEWFIFIYSLLDIGGRCQGESSTIEAQRLGAKRASNDLERYTGYLDECTIRWVGWKHQTREDEMVSLIDMEKWITSIILKSIHEKTRYRRSRNSLSFENLFVRFDVFTVL